MREKLSLITRDAFSGSVPSCGASCITSAESRSQCSSDDTFCLCTSGDFLEDALECAVKSCVVDDAESTQEVLEHQCQNAIENGDPNRPRKSTTSQPESSPTPTQTSTHTTALPSSTSFTSTDSSLDIGSPTLTSSSSPPASTSRSTQSVFSSASSNPSGNTGSQSHSTSSSIVISSSSGSTGPSPVSVQRGASSPSSSANSTSTSFPAIPSSLSGASSRGPSTTVIVALAVSLGAVALLALALSCILCAKRRRHRRAMTPLEANSFEPMPSLSPSSREEIVTVSQGGSQGTEVPEGKHEETDSASVASRLPSSGDGGVRPCSSNADVNQPYHGSVALSDISTAMQPQETEQSAPVGSTESESAAVALQPLTAQVDMSPGSIRSCELIPGGAPPSTRILSELTTPNSEKSTNLPTMSSARDSDNTASGWHLRSSQQESGSLSSSRYPLLSPQATASSGVRVTIWDEEFMDEEEPPPYEPRS
ncbi:hypothetical protein C8Q73DRAFT_190503 [Cubamyces lactineus]|nr:hypothetical protein C8Q73DRAFT_190503 [Cubamyces lactineus]